MDLINSAKTWIIVGAVIILVIEVRSLEIERTPSDDHFSVSGIDFRRGSLLSYEERTHVLFIVKQNHRFPPSILHKRMKFR